VSIITFGPSLNLTKQRPVGCPVEPKVFQKPQSNIQGDEIKTNKIKFKDM
jgi:hypothetical protein